MESTRASLPDELAPGLCGFFLPLSWLCTLAKIHLVLGCRLPVDRSGSPLSDDGKLADCKTTVGLASYRNVTCELLAVILLTTLKLFN
jgi:hypothetical protein